VKDQINSLFELSSVLGRPAFYGRWDRSTATEESVIGEAFVEFDRRHVLEKIRHWRGLGKDQNANLMEEDTTEDDLATKVDLVPWLCDRLALANSKQRVKLQYWSKNPCQLVPDSREPEERVWEEETEEASTEVETMDATQKQGLEPATSAKAPSTSASGVGDAATQDKSSQRTQDSKTGCQKGSNRVSDAPKPSDGAHGSCPYCGAEI
jgi:RNA polymerase-binding transcription factor DksA